MKKKILRGKSSNGLLSNKSLKDVCNLLLFVFRNVVRDLRGEMLMQLTYTPWLITGLHQTKKEREYTGIKKNHTNRNVYVFVYVWVWLEGLSRIVYPIKPAAGKLNQISVHLFLSRVQFMRQRLNASDILPHSGSDYKKKKNLITRTSVSNPTSRSNEKAICGNMPFHFILCSLDLKVFVCYVISVLSGLDSNLVRHWMKHLASCFPLPCLLGYFRSIFFSLGFFYLFLSSSRKKAAVTNPPAAWVGGE